MLRRWYALTALTALTALAAAAAARPAAAQQPEPAIKTTIDLGFVDVTGNTRIRTLNLGETFVHRRWAPWTFTQTFSAVTGRTAGATTAESWKAGLRADLAVAGRLKAYALVLFDRNRFAGISRRFAEAAGLSYGLLATSRDVLEAEAGVSRNQQRSTAAVVDDFWASRVAGRYRRNFTSTAYIQQTAELLSNLEQTEDERINTETALVAPLSRNLNLKLSYSIRFDNLPAPGFRDTDRILASAVQVVF